MSTKAVAESETFLIHVGPSAKCKFCSVHIAWGTTPEGKRIPVYIQARTDGGLTLDANGKLIRAIRSTPLERYFRSHLLDCKPLRDSLYKRTTIKLGEAGMPCDWPGCELFDEHRHCFNCGATDHFIADCEEEKANGQ